MSESRIGRALPTGALDPAWLKHPPNTSIQASRTTAIGNDQAAISLTALSPRRRPATAPLPLGFEAPTPLARPSATRLVRLDTQSALLHVDPISSNRAITASYTQINTAFRQYLGPHALSDWTALAENASTEAGLAIRQAREIRQALQTFVDGRVGGESQALAVLYDVLNQEGSISQGVSLVLANVGIDLATLGGMAKTLLFRDRRMAEASLRDSVMPVLDSLQNLERQLTIGNRTIYASIAPAYSLFLEAENQQDDGIAALQASSYCDSPLLIDAFRSYKLARASDDRLTARMFMQQGNELIARHEQEHVLQPHLAPIRAEMRSMSSTLSYLPPGSQQRVRLLPEGGDWGDVNTRLQAISRVSRTFLDHDMAKPRTS